MVLDNVTGVTQSTGRWSKAHAMFRKTQHIHLVGIGGDPG